MTLTSSNGINFIIDDVDYELVSKYTWRFNNKYIKTAIKQSDGRYKNTPLHRFLLQINDSKQQIDHINLNRLDNRRSNLRLCTPSQNQANIKAHVRNKTGYKGVRARYGKFEAYIWKNKSIYLGSFNTIKEAANAYNKAAIKLFGEFARLNEI